MRKSIGATVTPGDLAQYFKGKRDVGDEWNTRVRPSGMVVAECRTYNVELTPKGVMYSVEVAAADDPSDSDSKVTDNPVEFLVDFLGTGTSGDDFFKKRSSLDPEELQAVLLQLSDGIDCGAVGPKRLARILRRAMLLTDVESVRRIFATALRIAEEREDFELKDLAKLKAEMSEKGWKASVEEDDRGLPLLKVDVGGVYEAKVSIDHISWGYLFEVNGTDARDEGVTDDPISAFRDFYRTDEVKEAKSQQKMSREESGEAKAPSSGPKSAPDEGTVPARSKPKAEEGTVPAPSKSRETPAAE